jgi:hypothetical protein
MQHRITLSRVQRSFFLVGALAVAALAQAQNVYVDAANASSDAIGTVNFANPTGTFTVQNTDGGSLHSIRSLVFITNPGNLQLDLLAADNAGGEIVRYCGNFNHDPNASPPSNFSGVVVWNNTEGGPASPDGLSVDSAGNLFLVNQGSGTSTTPQLWVLQQLSGCVSNPPAPTSVLIDSTSFSAKQTLEETLVATTTIPLPKGAPVAQINPGDLLVLTSNPALVLIYPGSNGHGPTAKTTPFTLINLPAGVQPGGMAFWPVDNSLLVTIGTGTIFQYTPNNLSPNGTPLTFVSGLGNGQFKVKAARQGGNTIPAGLRSASLAYAFVADNNGGRLLEFNDQGVLISTVTTGVQHPQGLAVTNTAYTLASCLQSTCNVLGGNAAQLPLLTSQVTATVPGNIIEDVCIVPMDPRVVQYGSCTAAASAPKSPYAKGLPVAQMCGTGFDNPLNPLVISNSMCGATAGSGFALVKLKTQAYSGADFPLNGTYVTSDSEFSGLPSGPNDPVCNPTAGPSPPPFAVVGWAPLAGEGKGAGGNYLLDTTNGCDTRSGNGTVSLWAVGLALNTGLPGGLVGIATSDYTTLLNTLADEYSAGEGALTPPSPPAFNQLATGNFTYQLQQCIQTSQGAFLAGSANYSGAATELLTADYNVFLNAPAQPMAPFTGPFTPNGDYPNPSGTLRQLLENTSFTVGVRLPDIPGNYPGPAQPPTQPSPPLPTITGTPGTTVAAGHKYSFAPTTADFAGNTATLTYSLTGLPWATLSPAKKNNQVQVTGTAPAVPGNYPSVLLTVSDGCVTQSLPWSVTVTP